MAAESVTLREAILNALNQAAREFTDDGAMITHYVCIAEMVTVDGEYYLTSVTDDDPRPWIHGGMLQYALETEIYIEDNDDDEEDS